MCKGEHQSERHGQADLKILQGVIRPLLLPSLPGQSVPFPLQVAGLTKRMPEDEGEVVPLFPLLAELEEGSLPRFAVHEVYDEPVDLLVLCRSRGGA